MAAANRDDPEAIRGVIQALTVIGQSQLAAFVCILEKGNVAYQKHKDRPQIHAQRIALVMIDALRGRLAISCLFFLAANLESARASGEPLNRRCIEAAMSTKEFDLIYHEAEFFYKNPKVLSFTRQLMAEAIITLAKEGHQNAFFFAAELLRDGKEVPHDIEMAAHLFHKVAITGLMKAWMDLTLVPEALVECGLLAEATTTAAPREWQSYYEHQAQVAKEAMQKLFAFAPGEEIENLLDDDESKILEFKELARWKKPELESIIDVASFLNSDGGALIIGRSKKGEIVGIEPSLLASEVPNEDLYERQIIERLQSTLINFHQNDVFIRFHKIKTKSICVLHIKRSTKPIYVKTTSGFFIRPGNMKKELSAPDMVDYINRHWPNA